MQEETVAMIIVLDEDEIAACAKVAEIFHCAWEIADRQDYRVCYSDNRMSSITCKAIADIIESLRHSQEIIFRG